MVDIVDLVVINWACFVSWLTTTTIMPLLVSRQTHYEIHANGLPLVIKNPQWLSRA
jgi:hypothetical protein